ncbi:MAG: (Fe-S)-binding protein [Desulfatiglandaceae bacterium]
MDNDHLGAGTIQNFSWKQLLDAEACVSCGRCEEKCPAFLSGKPLSPRKVMGSILKQMGQVRRDAPDPDNPLFPYLMDAISADEIWSCTTCMACVEQCPVFIDPVDKIMDMRRYQVLGCGLLPDEARPMIRNLEIFGDVNGKGVAHREDWSFNLGVPHIGADGLNAEILLWVGCSGAFHPRYQEAMRAMVKILKAGEVRFGILGKEELCCGDVARRMGDEEIFLDLAMKNIASFEKYHVKKIVTLCPHGFNTLKNEYGALGGNFEVMHAVEFVLGLMKEKKISLRYPVAKQVTIHDPCYLGRVNHIYDPLREMIRSVPGIDLKELRQNRENAFCCGGGGGRMWLHENAGENINHLRAEEIKGSGVQLVGTACPFCFTMLEDGINSLEMEKRPKVMDLIEIIAASLEETKNAV